MVAAFAGVFVVGLIVAALFTPLFAGAVQRSQAGDGFAVFARTDIERVRRFETRVFSIADHVCVIGAGDAARVSELAPMSAKRVSILPPAVPVKAPRALK